MHDIKRPTGQGQAANETQNERSDLSARLRAVQAQKTERETDEVHVYGFKPLLPEGWYEAAYLGHQTAVVFNAQKVFLRFRITQHGQYNGVEVFRAYRVRALKGRPGVAGSFTLHVGGDLYQMLSRVLQVNNRADRISLRPLRSMLLQIELRTVTTNHKQQKLSEHAWYSVVDQIKDGS